MNRFLHQSTNHFIGGQFLPAKLEGTFASVNPADGSTLSQVASGTAEDINAAVEAASFGYKTWSSSSLKERIKALNEIAQLIDDNLADLAELESLDTGKPISETTHGDIPRAASNFRFFADLLTKEAPITHTSDDGSTHISQREPLGVCGLITPWNLPLYLATWKIAPALAMGNSIILKPAELTPLTANALAELMQKSSLPDGVFNVVHGFGENAAGQALVAHPDVACISFTGETTTGKAIMQASAPSLKKVSFELGGKGASVVFADADLEQAVPTVSRAAFRNQGQICLAGSRLIVESSIAENFVGLLLDEIGKIKLGPPQESSTTMGALIGKEHRDRVASYVDYAREQGCKILVGGKRPDGFAADSAYYEPTIILDPDQNSRLIQEEIFGPVLTVQTFDTKEEAMGLLNGIPYGLSCSIWSKNRETLDYASRAARCGLVWQNSWFLRNLNTPFGGMKQSGIGREGGTYSFNFFSEQKTISAPSV